jgi:hypothetical protein
MINTKLQSKDVSSPSVSIGDLALEPDSRLHPRERQIIY